MSDIASENIDFYIVGVVGHAVLRFTSTWTYCIIKIITMTIITVI